MTELDLANLDPKDDEVVTKANFAALATRVTSAAIENLASSRAVAAARVHEPGKPASRAFTRRRLRK